LKAWDKSANADSKGAVLFEQWFNKLNRDMYATPWSLATPVTTPDGLKDPEKAVELLVQAANEVIQKWGSLDIAYGGVNRFRAGNIDYPGNGGPDWLGVFRTMYFTEDKDKKNRAFHGDTYIAITELVKKYAQVFCWVMAIHHNQKASMQEISFSYYHKRNYVRPSWRKVMF
jgi:acyl-homoserine-lactone acylase